MTAFDFDASDPFITVALSVLDDEDDACGTHHGRVMRALLGAYIEDSNTLERVRAVAEAALAVVTVDELNAALDGESA